MSDENEQPEQQPSEGSQLRNELESRIEENKQLKQQLRTYAFKEAGVDPDKGVGRLVAQTYEGPAEASSIRQWMADNEIQLEQQAQQPGSQPAPQRQVTEGEEAKVRQTVDNVTQMRSTSSQPEGNRISYDEWKQNQLVDPKGAQEAFERGLVDIPQHIREHIG